MKKIILIFISILFVNVIFCQVVDKKAVAILKQLSEKTTSYSSIKIEFTYTMYNKEENIKESLDGILYLKGDKYWLKFMEQIVISDGKTNWAYNADAEEVQITEVDPKDESSNPAKLLTSYDKNYKSKLIKEKVENGIMVQTVDLVPLKGKSFYKIRLKINKSKKQIIKSIVYDKNNTIFIYNVKKFIPNLKISDTKFTFNKTKYPDVEVIDLR